MGSELRYRHFPQGLGVNIRIYLRFRRGRVVMIDMPTKEAYRSEARTISPVRASRLGTAFPAHRVQRHCYSVIAAAAQAPSLGTTHSHCVERQHRVENRTAHALPRFLGIGGK